MPTYEYHCDHCNYTQEIRHSIKEDPDILCEKCNKQMGRLMCWQGNVIIKNNSVLEHKEKEHKKKVKDPERAWRKRKKEFGRDEVGSGPVDKNDPRHTIRPNHDLTTMKQGRVIGGSQQEIDKKDLVKALAKDNAAVNLASDALKKKK